MAFFDFAHTPAGIILVLVLCTLFSGFIICTVARWTVLPALDRWLARQQQQRQQQLERQARLRLYLNDTRRRAMAAAAASEHAQRVQAGLNWLREMEERGRSHEEAIQAQEPAVAARRAEEYGVLLRRDLKVKLGLLRVDDDEVKDAIVFAEQFYSKQEYRPAKEGLLYDSDDEDTEVIRGDRKGKKDK